MTVTVDTRDGAPQVVLVVRIDRFTDREWLGAEAMPSTIAVVPWAPILAFAIEIDGNHACGCYPIGADPAEALAAHERLSGDAKQTRSSRSVADDAIAMSLRCQFTRTATMSQIYIKGSAYVKDSMRSCGHASAV